MEEKQDKEKNTKEIFYKPAIAIGLLIIIFLLAYVFIMKPRQEQRIYNECLNTLRLSDKFKDRSATDVRLLMEMCVKTGGREAKRLQRDLKEETMKELEERGVQIKD